MRPLSVIQASVFSLEKFLMEYEQIDEEPIHHFAPGIYAREMNLKKDNCIVGKIHRTEHLNILSKGKCIVFHMGVREIMIAPRTFTSIAGCKKAIYALEDMVWTTIHPTDETDLDKLEELLIMDESELKRLEHVMD